jgi:hypothetical protein
LVALDAISPDDRDRYLGVAAALQVPLQQTAKHLAALVLDQLRGVAERHRGTRQQLLLDPVHDRIRLAEHVVVGDRPRGVHWHQAANATRKRSIRTGLT